MTRLGEQLVVGNRDVGHRFVETLSRPACLELADDVGWTHVCNANQVQPDRGVAALVDGHAVAIFRLSPTKLGEAEEWRAVSHVDPATGAPIIARGLVGSVGTGLIVIPTVASPLYKQRYNVRTGYCLDDDSLRLEVYEVRIKGDKVECRQRPGH